jgi:hypothetical protein
MCKDDAVLARFPTLVAYDNTLLSFETTKSECDFRLPIENTEMTAAPVAAENEGAAALWHCCFLFKVKLVARPRQIRIDAFHVTNALPPKNGTAKLCRRYCT